MHHVYRCLLFTFSGFSPCLCMSAWTGCPMSLRLLLRGVSDHRSEKPSKGWVDTIITAVWQQIWWRGNFSMTCLTEVGRICISSLFISGRMYHPAVYLTPASWLKTYQSHTYAHTDTHSHTCIGHCDKVDKRVNSSSELWFSFFTCRVRG